MFPQNAKEWELSFLCDIVRNIKISMRTWAKKQWMPVFQGSRLSFSLSNLGPVFWTQSSPIPFARAAGLFFVNLLLSSLSSSQCWYCPYPTYFIDSKTCFHEGANGLISLFRESTCLGALEHATNLPARLSGPWLPRLPPTGIECWFAAVLGT